MAEMEMDIPLAEELEWLESSTLHNEEFPEEDEEELLHPSTTTTTTTPAVAHPSDAPPLSPSLQTSRKRPWVSDIDSEEKRSKMSAPEDGDDEEWLRYSPSKDPVGGLASVAVGAVEPDELPQAAAPEEMFLSRFASEIDGDCVPVTGPRGDRVYAKMTDEATGAAPRRLTLHRSGLLSEPIHVLMEMVEREALTKALQESTESPADTLHATNPVSEQLWPEKYAPKSFTELLSDEQTNREVLLWLKQWDSSVFGSQIRATSDDVLAALRRHSSMTQHQKTFDNNSVFGKKLTPLNDQLFKQPKDADHKNDNLKDTSELWTKKSKAINTPEQKVLLLCGPPGLGKTTLAHVAAIHSGYRVVEINASDDRSSSTIESKILDVVQMNSVMADARPKCLVIDEIDGALGEGKGAVDVILKMVGAEKKPAVSNRDSSPDSALGKNAKKRHKTTNLSRPVICICNDLYAPALRPLRQIAKVHTFVQPAVTRVVNRLKYICKKEGYKTSSVALTALAEYTECDIRSCLNTLQFLNKKKEALNILEVDSQVVGRKDMSKSAFDVWKEVFQKKGKHDRKSINGCGTHRDFGFLDSLISNRGDYELTMDGIHENFLQLCYHDPVMQKSVRCLDVIGVSDSFLRYTMRTQQMSLHAYQPCIAITISRLIAQIEKPNIEWPKSLQRGRAMHIEKKDLLRSWHYKISPYISRHMSNEAFVEDVVSPLLHVLSPLTLRPVALHLLSEREKEDLTQLVDTMVSYSIAYKTSKPESLMVSQKHGSSSDASIFSFDPPIDEFVNFKGYESGHAVLSLATKQIVMHEMEMHRILMGSGAKLVDANGERNNGNYDPTVTSKPFSSAMHSSPESNREIPKVSSTLEVKNSSNAGMKIKNYRDTKRSSCQHTNFFDRFKGPSKDSKNLGNAAQKQGAKDRNLHPLLFKYNEGFTNAVKRPVRVRELI
uniref:Chromosome transmission fidelity protein 18 homolog n=1 Tax=Anthurium amnicola TaxID=1678845 RepID=A0A1D1XQK4_9ARAE